MKRNYIQPKSEFVEFGTNNNIMDLTIQMGSSGQTIDEGGIESNHTDFDDNIDWDDWSEEE